MDFNKIFFMRPTRVVSYFLVSIKKYKYIPFFSSCSAVLLDISFTGFKMNIEGRYKLTPGQKFYLSMPLAPLAIKGAGKLEVKCECKWFDAEKMRAGCVFVGLTNDQELLIDKIITQLLKNNSQEQASNENQSAVV